MTNNAHNFNNPASRKEREELLREAQLPTTYSKLASLGDDLGGGRFAVEQTKATDYPRLPAGPWSAGYGDAGLEPPIGIDVTAVEPCGEQFEIERSISELAQEGHGCVPDCADKREASPPCAGEHHRSAIDAPLPSTKLVGGGSLTPTAVAQHLASAPERFETLPSTNPKPLKRRKL
jgi:hypothetical protein